MPGPLAVVGAVGLVLDVVGIGFSIYDIVGGQSTNDKLDALEGKIDALQQSIDDLGADLLREMAVIEALIPTVAINTAVADARAARGELARLLATENPSAQQRLDTIASAEQAYLRVLGQARTILNGDNATSAIGLFGALVYTASVRLEVAHTLEDGAMGADVLRASLAETATVLRQIAGVIPGQLYKSIQTNTEVTSRIENGKIVYKFVTTAFSPLSDVLETNMVEKAFFPHQAASGVAKEMAFRTLTLEPAFADRLAKRDFDFFGFDELATAADQFAGLADGVQRNGSSVRDVLVGTDGNDLLIGLAGNDRLDGGADGDVLYGGSGDDTLSGRDGIDVLDGGQGNDTLRGGADADILRGAAGLDVLEGNSGNDHLFGGSGRDQLTGGAGKDTLDGGAGSDTLTGGAGADLFVFSADPGTGRDVVKDFVSGLDQIFLDGSVFDRLPTGTLAAPRLQFTAQASGSSAKLLYHNGVLSYDADGSGAGAPVEIARFTGSPDLAAADFFVL